MTFATLNVLLIESDAGVIRLVNTALSTCASQRFVIRQTDHLEDGIAYLSAGGEAEVILACLALPDIQGLATLSRLHEQSPLTPIIVLSHDNDDSAAVKAVQAGAQDFLIRCEIDHALVSAIRHAIERAQMLAELSAARDELEKRVEERTSELRAGQTRLRALSQRLVEVQEAERRHLARELHDEVGQILTGLKLRLETVKHLPPDEAAETLNEARRGVSELMQRVREMSLSLRPAVLDDLGLLAALTWHLERYTAQTGVHIEFIESGLKGRRFAAPVETAAFRIVQEALTNIARHAGVDEATVTAHADDRNLTVEISDDGRGFDSLAVSETHNSTGIAGMMERALLLGGQLCARSAPDAGTTITAELPIK